MTGLRFHGIVVCVLLLSAVVSVQGSAQRRLPAPQPPALLLYDALTLTEGLAVTLRGVIVRAAGSADTIPGVLTEDTPVLIGDTMVVGFSCDSSGTLARTFRYHIGKKSIELFPAPPDAQSGLSNLTFSPDARRIAYVRFSAGQGTPVIRSWPDGVVLLEGTPTPVYGSDGTGGLVGWESMDRAHFLILIPPGSPRPNRWWYHATADVRERRMRADTVVVTGP